MDDCWILCQVMAGMKKVYDNLIIINLNKVPAIAKCQCVDLEVWITDISNTFFALLFWLTVNMKCEPFNHRKWKMEVSSGFNPNWHEAGNFPLPVFFGLDFWQLNFYQKFPNFFGSENWHQSG